MSAAPNAIAWETTVDPVIGPAAEEVDGPAGERASGPLDYGILPGLVGYQLRRAQVAAFRNFARTVGAGGMTPPLFGLLTLIANNGGRPQVDLAKAIGIDGSTLVIMIDKLEAKGLVERQRASSDRRTHALHATGRGCDLLARLEPVLRAHEADLTRDLSPQEKRALLDLLKRVAKRARPGSAVSFP